MVMLKRKPAASTVTPERAVLAEAIAAAAKADAEQAAMVAEGDRASRAVWDATTALTQAQTDLEDAGKGTSAEALRAARAAVIDAEEQLSATRAIRDTMKAKLAARYTGFAQDRLKSAAIAVMRAEAGDFVADLSKRVVSQQRQLTANASVLKWMEEKQVLPVSREIGGGYGRAADDETRLALSRMWIPPSQWAEPGVMRHTNLVPDGATAAIWDVALAALMADAAAPLPLGDV